MKALAAAQVAARPVVAPKLATKTAPPEKPKRVTRPAAAPPGFVAGGKIDAPATVSDSKLATFKVTERGPTVHVPTSGTTTAEPTLAELEKLTAPTPKS